MGLPIHDVLYVYVPKFTEKYFFTETLSAFVAAFSICSVEALAGTISIILHQLSQDIDLQEKIRDKDRVEFTLEGLPRLDEKFLSEPLYIDSLIKGNSKFKYNIKLIADVYGVYMVMYIH